MDGFFGIGIQELVLIAIVALIVLGPERLPATFREIAKFIRYVRNLTNEFTAQFGDDFKALEDLDPRRMLQREIESIDAEETKPAAKPTPAKTTPTKTTTATPKSTTTTAPKPAAATTAKSTTSTTSTAKPAATQASTKAASTTETKPTEAATATTSDAPPASSEPVATTTAAAPPVTETENRIAPPAVTAPATEQSVASVAQPVVHGGTTNGVVPKEVEAITSTNGTAVTIATNDVQSSTPTTQAE